MISIHGLRRHFLVSLFLGVLFVLSADVSAEATKTFTTSYCNINYSDEKCLSDFFWKISGKRFDFSEVVSLARSRVDWLVDRVQAILDMYPDNFRITIQLYPEYKNGMIAVYSSNTNSIRVYTDKVTDGVLAHELAHAVMCAYFGTNPPGKMQEILCQYVDKHLWTDY